MSFMTSSSAKGMLQRSMMSTPSRRVAIAPALSLAGGGLPLALAVVSILDMMESRSGSVARQLPAGAAAGAGWQAWLPLEEPAARSGSLRSCPSPEAALQPARRGGCQVTALSLQFCIQFPFPAHCSCMHVLIEGRLDAVRSLSKGARMQELTSRGQNQRQQEGTVSWRGAGERGAQQASCPAGSLLAHRPQPLQLQGWERGL